MLLLATAGLNALGYPQVIEKLAASGMKAVWSAGLKAVWLIFSVHLVVIAAATFESGVSATTGTRSAEDSPDPDAA